MDWGRSRILLQLTFITEAVRIDLIEGVWGRNGRVIAPKIRNAMIGIFGDFPIRFVIRRKDESPTAMVQNPPKKTRGQIAARYDIAKVMEYIKEKNGGVAPAYEQVRSKIQHIRVKNRGASPPDGVPRRVDSIYPATLPVPSMTVPSLSDGMGVYRLIWPFGLSFLTYIKHLHELDVEPPKSHWRLVVV
ncbi:hypothetical protein B0H14DRAFT_2621012 [Mycena olivaceomarginata]|nr:hypothetical protein B0H14DRAFT_2621012 [Mycena olivaceomarginata]